MVSKGVVALGLPWSGQSDLVGLLAAARLLPKPLDGLAKVAKPTKEGCGMCSPFGCPSMV